MNKTVLEKTIKYNLCINCGMCKVVCPKHLITLNLNKYGELNPSIDNSKCNNCGQCSLFCPNTKEKFCAEAKKISSVDAPHSFGLENASYYLAWNPNKEQRQKCCSGGAVTQLALSLLENHKIDGLIHVERLWGHRGNLHYGARLSKSVEEICEHVSSAYQPIDFSDVLQQLEQGKTYLICGTPCVIRGIKYLFAKHKIFENINILTCALVCSHNTNAQFIDFLTEINELSDDEKWKVNIRYKDDSIADANNFKNFIYTPDKELLNKNRFDSGWTHIWRNYYFAMGACLKCSDFWGYEADISIKDAWGEWAKNPLGTSIAIIRNKDLEQDFLNSGLEYKKLSFETMEWHQAATSVFKQTEAYNKNFKSVFSRSNRRNELFKYFLISKISKMLHKNFGYKVTKFLMPLVEWIGKRGQKL